MRYAVHCYKVSHLPLREPASKRNLELENHVSNHQCYRFNSPPCVLVFFAFISSSSVGFFPIEEPKPEAKIPVTAGFFDCNEGAFVDSRRVG